MNRAELHLHTKFSTMDSVGGTEEYFKYAKNNGFSALAITDHGNVRAFPEAYSLSKKYGVKLIYGLEAYMIDDKKLDLSMVENYENKTFVVVDIETTGLSYKNDRITEIGAIRIENGALSESFHQLVNPQIKIPDEIAELTGITNEMVKDEPIIKDVIPKLKEFCDENIIVAHNADFDMNFLKNEAARCNTVFDYETIDTLELSRYIFPNESNYKLSSLVNKLKIKNDNPHRATDDAQATAEVFLKLVEAAKSGPEEQRAKLKDLLRGVSANHGMHPGGMFIFPKNSEITDYTPYNHAADDVNAPYTTQFEYLWLTGCLLKFDILQHDSPTILHRLENETGFKIDDIPLNDKKTFDMFASGDTDGIPEFSTDYVKAMLKKIKPRTFDELIKISGVSHGTGVWIDNAEGLVNKGVIKFSEVLSTRDDITLYLLKYGFSMEEAFEMSERVRKGIGLTDEMIEDLQYANVPQWFIESCQKILYMFPRAHAASYVLFSYRITYYKAHYPEMFNKLVI